MLVIYFSRLNDKEKATTVESADREREAGSKPKVDNKMEQDKATAKRSNEDRRGGAAKSHQEALLEIVYNLDMEQDIY